MKKIAIVLFSLWCSSILANEVFILGGRSLVFLEKNKLLLSGCKKTCDALKAIKGHKKIDLHKFRNGQNFVNSLGSEVCSKVYKAGSLLGRNSNRDGRAFCVFKDGSMVEMNSLSDYLVEQKIVH